MTDVLLDQFGDFGPTDLASLVFSMIAAAFIVYLLGFAQSKEHRKGVMRDMVLAAVMASAVTVVMGSLPLAMAFAGVMVAARIFAAPDAANRNATFTVIALVIGLICGARAVVVALIAAVPLFFLLRMAARKSS